MSDAPRYGKAKISTVMRDLNALRKAIRAHDPEATEAAWEKVERWVDIIPAVAAKYGESR
jgi:hypothetical protein